MQELGILPFEVTPTVERRLGMLAWVFGWIVAVGAFSTGGFRPAHSRFPWAESAASIAIYANLLLLGPLTVWFKSKMLRWDGRSLHVRFNLLQASRIYLPIDLLRVQVKEGTARAPELLRLHFRGGATISFTAYSRGYRDLRLFVRHVCGPSLRES
jgi:hypothetical protein